MCWEALVLVKDVALCRVVQLLTQKRLLPLKNMYSSELGNDQKDSFILKAGLICCCTMQLGIDLHLSRGVCF